jgi:alpha-L-fucosidase
MEFQNIDPLWKKTHNRSDELGDEAYRKYLGNTYFNDDILDPVRNVIESFRPDNFDANEIVDLAVAAGMKYITFTTQHICGRMFMFDTTVSAWNSKRVLNRDFVAELTTAAQKRGMGVFFYVMPPFGVEKERIFTFLTELLTNYGSIAGIWFDGIWAAYKRPKAFLRTAEFYAHIRTLQPHCLVSFKTGFTGDEDFTAPEVHQITYGDGDLPELTRELPPASHEQLDYLRLADTGVETVRQSVADVWRDELRYKPVEICTTMIRGNKWFDTEGGEHLNTDEVVETYRSVRSRNANLLLNVGPRGDGSVHPEDEAALREAAAHIEPNQPSPN